MSNRQPAGISKPTLKAAAALTFAKEDAPARQGRGKGEVNKAAQSGSNLSGKVPQNDVRLTANINQELHLKLKIEAANRRTTIGELLEELIEQM